MFPSRALHQANTVIVLIDQDGPLADFERGFLENWKRKFPDELCVPLEKRRSLKVRDDYPEHLREKVESVYFEEGFCKNLPLVQGATEAVQSLIELGHDVRICTSPLSRYENCVLEKYKWVEQHFGREFTKRIIVTKDKTLIKGRYLIDDSPEIQQVPNIEWDHVIFDAPYNRAITSRPRITWKNWQEILKI